MENSRCVGKISFTDAVLIGLARETGSRLVTFDRKMIAIAKRH